MRVTLGVAIFMTLLVSVNDAGAEECDEKTSMSANQVARRAAALQYLITVNTAQGNSQHARGRYVPLNEATGLGPTPYGFVPKLIFDQWGYLISLHDIFDPCGFTLFSDEHGAIYESRRRVIVTEKTQPSPAVEMKCTGFVGEQLV